MCAHLVHQPRAASVLWVGRPRVILMRPAQANVPRRARRALRSGVGAPRRIRTDMYHRHARDAWSDRPWWGVSSHFVSSLLAAFFLFHFVRPRPLIPFIAVAALPGCSCPSKSSRRLSGRSILTTHQSSDTSDSCIGVDRAANSCARRWATNNKTREREKTSTKKRARKRNDGKREKERSEPPRARQPPAHSPGCGQPPSGTKESTHFFSITVRQTRPTTRLSSRASAARADGQARLARASPPHRRNAHSRYTRRPRRRMPTAHSTELVQ